jgi:hypothetical protein
MRIIDRTLIYNVFVFDRSLTWSKLYFSNIYNENMFQAHADARWHGINHAFFNICFHDFFNTISLLFRLIFLYWKYSYPYPHKFMETEANMHDF